MRLFIATELPAEVREALAETSARLRERVRGRYVAPDSFHVTLAFLGNVDYSLVDCVADALEEGCRGVHAFDVALGDLGSFGRRSKAVLWQGFRDAGALPKLACSVRAELHARDLPCDDKPFRAHITLMRAANLAEAVLPPSALASGRIDAVTLFRSDLSWSRPIYEPVHEVLMDGASSGGGAW